jgi:hypothetical protein
MIDAELPEQDQLSAIFRDGAAPERLSAQAKCARDLSLKPAKSKPHNEQPTCHRSSIKHR